MPDLEGPDADPAPQIGVKDVAKRAGVSVGTVSNVLNRPEQVGATTRTRVLAVIDELGFVRNEAARQLRVGRSRTIGLVVLDVANPFFTDLAAGVEAAAAGADLSVILCNSGDDREREERHLRMLEEQRTFGILITPVDNRAPLIEKIRRRGTSVVLADRGSSGRMCSVSVNDVLGGELAVGHLVHLGHRRIAFVGGPTSIPQVTDRLGGARAAIDPAGPNGVSLRVIETAALTFAAGRQAATEILAIPEKRRPTAVFCANDLVALGLLQEAIRCGITVPGELSVVGYDDIDFAAASTVPLTSVRQPRAHIGRAAADLLIEEVLSPHTHTHRQVVFEPDLIVRQSTASPQAGPTVAAGSPNP